MEQELNARFQNKIELTSTQPAREIKLFSQTNMLRIQELQDINEKLHRQILQIEKDIHNSSDALSLLAEKERCVILIARNSGEIAKIHVENEERLRRISELEVRNKRLAVDKVAQRESFGDIRDPQQRIKHASDYFLTQSRMEKNADEIFELNQE